MPIDGDYCSGRLHVTTSEIEMRMSHWVARPYITLISTGAVCLDLSQSLWDLYKCDETPAGLVITLREYPGDKPAITGFIDAETGALELGGIAVRPEDAPGLLVRRSTA